MKRVIGVRRVTGRIRGRMASQLNNWLNQPERGDVPGWVLITVMTAGLVAALWLIAEPLLANLFSTAISGVTGP
ncbi:hypothetical protein [Ornithinimicrobium sp. INDO-MA30-4]|uniref:hypothetical protein n=1 Tax=Ornithinimicrobium sp. INDO-MA30-4 TaxID=2908651 RepID=UPI001F1DF18B|nr:hypothetical protein [Ornithinimicrobium sp. INDO-MA30-4]UJH71710.1 hypothetical protein L0A91_01605 [Ornithinimicrobium sp. INDO-MA30-4]